MSETHKVNDLSPLQVRDVILLVEALSFYADPSSYHAITIMGDPPCGEFFDDMSEDHGDEYYQRAMPGKLARDVLSHLGLGYGEPHAEPGGDSSE